MRLSKTVKPISYVKAHAAEIIKDMRSGPNIITITQNGEAKAILQDIQSYEAMQETLALLKALTLSMDDVKNGRVASIDDTMEEIDKIINQDGNEKT